jgi:diacylglycerol O-acyltransferase
MTGMPRQTAIERVSSSDLMQLASDSGPVPMQVGVILLLDPARSVGPADVRARLADRARRVPRLRQRLMRVPFGCGRPIWVDDADFDVDHHVRFLACPAPADSQALLALATDLVTERLPMHRPLWSIVITGLADGTPALIAVMHHVVADGIAGLALLGQLVDGVTVDGSTATQDFPRPSPPASRLFADATLARLHALTRLPSGVRMLLDGVAELRTRSGSSAPACSLNRPTGRRRSILVLHTDLSAVRAAAHANGATVNDVVLTAVTGALGRLLIRRGEQVTSLVVSVPITAPRPAGAGTLGNRVGVMPVRLPTGGEPQDRLRAVAGITREHKRARRGASQALLAPASRALGTVGLLQAAVNHQRLVNTFVTDLRGPTSRLVVLGSEITDASIVPGLAGNVTVSFAALSYAGALNVTVMVDPDHGPDLGALAPDVQAELDALTGGPSSLRSPDRRRAGWTRRG